MATGCQTGINNNVSYGPTTDAHAPQHSLFLTCGLTHGAEAIAASHVIPRIASDRRRPWGRNRPRDRSTWGRHTHYRFAESHAFGRFGGVLNTIRGRSGVGRSGSVWGPSGVHLRSVWGQAKADPASSRGGSGVDLGSTKAPLGRSSVWTKPRPNTTPATAWVPERLRRANKSPPRAGAPATAIRGAARNREAGRDVANRQHRAAKKHRETRGPKGLPRRSGSFHRQTPMPPVNGDTPVWQERSVSPPQTSR